VTPKSLISAVYFSLPYAISSAINNTEAIVLWVASGNVQGWNSIFIAGHRLCPSRPQSCRQATSGAGEQLVTRATRRKSSDASICIAFTPPSVCQFHRAKPLLQEWTQQTSIVWSEFTQFLPKIHAILQPREWSLIILALTKTILIHYSAELTWYFKITFRISKVNKELISMDKLMQSVACCSLTSWCQSTSTCAPPAALWQHSHNHTGDSVPTGVGHPLSPTSVPLRLQAEDSDH
jgi:hypothetical protein